MLVRAGVGEERGRVGERRGEKLKNRIRVTWTGWGTKPPYGIIYERWLTCSQHTKFMDKCNRLGLTHGTDYALRVGRKQSDTPGEALCRAILAYAEKEKAHE